MIKTIAFIKRKPALTREEFARHYEEVHAPLAARTFPTIKKYVRNHIIQALDGPDPDFDCISEFWFEDQAGIESLYEIWGSDAGKAVREDEESFIDSANTRAFVVDERVSDL